MEKQLTVIIPLIRDDLIERCLETLYEYTPPGTFYVYIVDQTIHGVDATKLRNKYRNLMVIRSPKSDTYYTGNLGFAKACNLGIRLVETPYFMLINDDVELIHPAYWDGVLESFKQIDKATPESPAVIVNLASIRLADWSVGAPAGEDFDIIPYKDKYTNEDWDFLVNEPHYINKHLTIQPGSVFDGVTLYASVAKTKEFLEIGLLDERYHPGSGEDYCYSCRARMYGYRSVCTTLSWCFHHWSSSFKSMRDQEEIQSLRIPELAWNHNHEKWGKSFNIWGIPCQKCEADGKYNPLQVDKNNAKIATCLIHPDEIYDMPPQTKMPL